MEESYEREREALDASEASPRPYPADRYARLGVGVDIGGRTL